MDWANEPYVRVYTRETDDDLALSYDALSLWGAMLKKFDRSGLIETKRGIAGLAAITRCPIERVPDALAELVKDGRVTQVSNGYFAPNFLAAQETPRTDKARQRDSRSKRAAKAHSERRENTSVSHGVTLTSADPDPRQGLSDPPAREVTSDRDGSPGEGLADRQDELAEAPPLPPYPPLRDATRSAELPLTEELTSSLAHVQLNKGIAKRVWGRLETVRRDVAKELGLTVRELHPFDAGTRALAARIRESQVAKLDEDRIESDLNHVIDIAVTEARLTKSVQFLSGSMFEEKTYRRALAMTLDDVPNAARKPRDAPRSPPSPPPTEPNRFKTLPRVNHDS